MDQGPVPDAWVHQQITLHTHIHRDVDLTTFNSASQSMEEKHMRHEVQKIAQENEQKELTPAHLHHGSGAGASAPDLQSRLRGLPTYN